MATFNTKEQSVFMIRIYLPIIFCLVAIPLFGQNEYNSSKADQNWMVGYLSKTPDSIFGGALIDFSKVPVTSKRKNLGVDIGQTSVTYSDRQGNLILVSNGREVVDSSQKVIVNGTEFEVGLQGYSGNAGNQTTLVLDWPDDSNRIAMVYVDTKAGTNPTIFSEKLLYSVIQKDVTTSKWVVFSKNNVALQKKMSPSQLTACRHGNGRDWWIVKQSVYTDTIFKFLLTNRGVEYFGFQKVSQDKNLYGLGQSIFSPDGRRYAAYHGVTINATSRFVVTYDFDRCSGDFANRKYFYVDTARAVCGGAAISPNSKYLYVAFTNFVFQYDLEASDIGATKDTVLLRNFEKDPFASAFYQAQLAPDGKIYIATQNTTTYYHVINYPDRKGDSCMAVQAGFDLATFSSGIVPNNPNYRLGRLKGSPCDTIRVATIDITADQYDLKIYPNPATDLVQIEITLPNYDPSTKSEIVLVDVSGEIVQRYTMPDFAYLATLDISKLPSGVFGVQLRQRDRVLAVEKLVVVR